MLSIRSEIILSSIVRRYITNAVPVSSSSILEDCGLDVCSATIRNEVVRLEQEGYIIRPHHSAGSVPSDKGYRYYVESLKGVKLPETEQVLIGHLYHQVEKELEEWLNLTVSVLSQRVHNMAMVTVPKPPAARVHHLDLVSLQENLALVVLILHGAKVKQQLVTFDKLLTQMELSTISNRLNDAFYGLNRAQIEAKQLTMAPEETQVRSVVLKLMRAEEEQRSDEPYLDGLHYTLEQPEFSRSERGHTLMEMVEDKKLGKAVLSEEPALPGVQVFIGHENKSEAIQDYSVVLARYGLPDEAEGTIGVVGPTRMAYERAMSAIGYLSLVMSTLVAELYGKPPPAKG